MLPENPMVTFAFLLAMLVAFIVFKRLGLGLLFRFVSLGIALILWYGAAGGIPGMVDQVKVAAQTVADWGRSLGESAGSTSLDGGSDGGSNDGSDGGSDGEGSAKTSGSRDGKK